MRWARTSAASISFRFPCSCYLRWSINAPLIRLPYILSITGLPRWHRRKLKQSAWPKVAHDPMTLLLVFALKRPDSISWAFFSNLRALEKSIKKKKKDSAVSESWVHVYSLLASIWFWIGSATSYRTNVLECCGKSFQLRKHQWFDMQSIADGGCFFDQLCVLHRRVQLNFSSRGEKR